MDCDISEDIAWEIMRFVYVEVVSYIFRSYSYFLVTPY